MRHFRGSINYDPFRRPALVRAPSSVYLYKHTLKWYMSHPGASGRGKYQNGSKMINMCFMLKCAIYLGPFD